MSRYKVGDIVRYSGGSTAFLLLDRETDYGSWYGYHCLGGYQHCIENDLYSLIETEMVFAKELFNEVFDKAISQQNSKLEYETTQLNKLIKMKGFIND